MCCKVSKRTADVCRWVDVRDIAVDTRRDVDPFVKGIHSAEQVLRAMTCARTATRKASGQETAEDLGGGAEKGTNGDEGKRSSGGKCVGNNFDGHCRNCGKHGHRAEKCCAASPAKPAEKGQGCKGKQGKQVHDVDERVSVAILAQANSCPNVRCVFPVHELFWFCLVKVSTTQFCCLPPFPMARVCDGTDVPVSPLPASSSNIGYPDGSLPDLERTGSRPSTMEEKINEINLRLPLFLQNASRINNCVQTLSQTVSALMTKITSVENC